MDDKYKLGIKMIDEQHQRIFDLIDLLCDIDRTDKKRIKAIIEELKDYSEYHFKSEEEYFKSIKFTETDNHIHLHGVFIQTIEYYYDFPNKLSKKKLYTFLNTWIKHHILVEDKKYVTKEYIK